MTLSDELLTKSLYSTTSALQASEKLLHLRNNLPQDINDFKYPATNQAEALYAKIDKLVNNYTSIWQDNITIDPNTTKLLKEKNLFVKENRKFPLIKESNLQNILQVYDLTTYNQFMKSHKKIHNQLIEDRHTYKAHKNIYKPEKNMPEPLENQITKNPFLIKEIVACVETTCELLLCYASKHMTMQSDCYREYRKVLEKQLQTIKNDPDYKKMVNS